MENRKSRIWFEGVGDLQEKKKKYYYKTIRKPRTLAGKSSRGKSPVAVGQFLTKAARTSGEM